MEEEEVRREENYFDQELPFILPGKLIKRA